MVTCFSAKSFTNSVFSRGVCVDRNCCARVKVEFGRAHVYLIQCEANSLGHLRFVRQVRHFQRVVRRFCKAGQLKDPCCMRPEVCDKRVTKTDGGYKGEQSCRSQQVMQSQARGVIVASVAVATTS